MRCAMWGVGCEIEHMRTSVTHYIRKTMTIFNTT